MLVLTVSEDPEDVADAIMAGATGYVVKGADDDEVRATIHRVAAGERVLARKVASALVERTRPVTVENGEAAARAAARADHAFRGDPRDRPPVALRAQHRRSRWSPAPC